jgi:predicted DNA-binding transcriptional regulator AlpA
VLDAGEVAQLLGRERQWVYDHAADLGAFRFGDGPRARLGFDLASVERWKRERRARAEFGAQRARSSSRPPAAVAGDLIPYEPRGSRP